MPVRCAAALVVAVLVCWSCDARGNALLLDLPRRPADAASGTEIARAIRTLELGAREERIYAEISRGNVPSWLRRLRRVEVAGEVEGRRRRVKFWVTPDYLAVGSDDDFFLIPLSAQTAQRVADLVGGSLPTPRMVDAIWASADVRVNPIRLRLNEHRATVSYFERHDNLVKAQRRLHAASPGIFLAGHKLDVVLTPTLAAHPAKASLYGWHRSSGEPIQPLYTAATDSMVIFSHGIRLVDRRVLVDGVRKDLWDVLRDPELAPILSDQGVIAHARYPAVRREK